MAILAFQKPDKVILLESDSKYGKFEFRPLEPGFGITVGNALRRILLSSLEGYAINTVRIEGVEHEFSAVPGVKEDVTEIVMNIKEICIKSNGSSNEVKTAYIDASGDCVVTAGDIQMDGDLEILNPDLVIANLSGSDAKLEMELTITNGRGYVGSDKNKDLDASIDAIAIDSIYTPVERVNLTVENTRVGQITDYDKLTLDVWTNGVINAQEAVSLAAKVLTEHLNLFVNLSDSVTNSEMMQTLM